MAVYKNYVNKFYSQRGNRWDLEIWSRSDSSLDSVEFATGKGGFKLSYKGGDDRQDITMPSEVTIPFIVSNANDEAFINGFLTADDKEYLLLIRRNFVIFWFGNLNAGFDNKQDDTYPYITTLKANDFLGEAINDKDFSTITDTSISLAVETFSFWKEISDIIVWDNDIFPLSTSELIYKTNLRWTAPNMYSYADNTSIFNQFFINPLGFSNDANYPNKYKKSDTFKEILKAFGLKMFIADGKLYCLQPYNYIENTTKFQNYSNDNTGAFFPVANDDIDNRQNANNDITSATDLDDGFQLKDWILQPANFTDSIWQANGSCTLITSNSFNVALITSNLYIDLTEGEYCLSYSENDTSVYIAKEESGVVTTLLEESGHKNFSIGSGGGELRVYTSVVGTLTVEHISLQKGAFTHRSFLANTSFRYDRPISTVTGTFPFGFSSAVAMSNFPSPDDTNTTDSIYTTFQSIGAISASDAENVQMRFNVFYGERFDFLSAANNITHVGGSLELKLRIGNLYLTGALGNVSWTTTDSTFVIPISIESLTGTYQDGFQFQTNELICQSFVPNATDGFFFGPGNDGSMGFVGVNLNVTLPTLQAGGDVSLQFVDATVNYYTNPDTSNPNVDPTPVTLTKNNLITKWFTGSNFSASGTVTNLQIYTFAQENNIQGVEHSASTALNNYRKVDLGNIRLGISGDETTHLNCITTFNPSFENVVPNYLQVNNTGTQYNMTTLLLEQYLEPQIEPLEIIQGDYYVNDFSAFKSIVLKGNKYVFFEGTLTAEDDVVSGSWYKMAASSETITTEEDDLIFIEDDTPPPQPPPNPHDPQDPVPVINIHNITNGITKGKNWIKYNSIGLSNSAISTTDTKVDLMNASRAKLYSGQKLIFAKPDLSDAIILTKLGDSTTSDTQIDVSSFTPDVTYPAGSILAIAQYDLTNVITGGGGGTPAGSNTEVQFNNSGAFGASSKLTFDDTNDRLDLKGNFRGGNIGRFNWNNIASELRYFLNPSDFILSSNSRAILYTREDAGSVISSNYDSRSNDIYAMAFLPKGYEITKVDVYTNTNLTFSFSYSNYNTDTVTSIVTGGTTNTTLTLNTAHTVDERQYYIIRVETSSISDEIWGGLITLDKS